MKKFVLIAALIMAACSPREKEPTLQDCAESLAKSLITAEYGVEGYAPVSTIVDTMFVIGTPTPPEPDWTWSDSLVNNVTPVVCGSVIRNAPSEVQAELRADISGISGYDISHRCKIMGENGIYTYSTFVIEANEDMTEGRIYDRTDFAYSDK